MIRKLTFYTLLMLLIPLITWILGWQWQGDQYLQPKLDMPLLWITDTGTVPYGLITCVVLLGLLIFSTRHHYNWKLIVVICGISMVGTQGIKSVSKKIFAEPRPYVELMMQDNSETFYALSKPDRIKMVTEYFSTSAYPQINEHRQHEVGYSFPSGHTIFSVSWLLLFVGFLLHIHNKTTVLLKSTVLLWSALMLISRLRLGMHYPIDLFVSTLISFIFHCLLFIFLVPYLAKWKPLKPQNPFSN